MQICNYLLFPQKIIQTMKLITFSSEAIKPIQFIIAHFT